MSIEQHYLKNYRKLVKVVLNRVGRDQHLAEEAVQEAYKRALTYQHCCDVKEFDNWFGTILNNSVKDLMKSERNRGLSIEECGDIEDDFDIDLAHYRDAIAKSIKTTKNKLHREILDLYINKGVSYEGVVQLTLAPSENMVRKVVSRFKLEVCGGL